MSPRPSHSTPPASPWPIQTALPPLHLSPRKRKRQDDANDSNDASQPPPSTITDFDQVESAKTSCELDSGNQVLSCFPTTDTVVPQHKFVSFVWNSNVPQFLQTEKVNIYLLTADRNTVVHSWLNQVNPRGQAGDVTWQVDDSWFPNNGTGWNGQNLTYPYFFVITRNDVQRTGAEPSQAVFSAVQTTFADAVVASMSSASVASASASASASAAATLTGAASSSTTAVNGSSTNGGPGSVQGASSDSGFPHWAIAVITILGFLAIASSCILLFFCCRRARKQNERDYTDKRGSLGSASPMMEHAAGPSPGSPLLAGAAAIGPHQSDSQKHESLPSQKHSSVASPDRSSISGSVGDAGPFSGADAAIMADAFRKALRKPDFAGRPEEEGESPPEKPVANQTEGDELLREELADEGRDIRSVASSRGVKVETSTLSDSGSTIQDHLH